MELARPSYWLPEPVALDRGRFIRKVCPMIRDASTCRQRAGANAKGSLHGHPLLPVTPLSFRLLADSSCAWLRIAAGLFGIGAFISGEALAHSNHSPSVRALELLQASTETAIHLVVARAFLITTG